MSLSVEYALFGRQLDSFDPHSDGCERSLALYAASITLADPVSMTRALETARAIGASRSALYEIVLQSYLFLGFPRMLIAAEHLHELWPSDSVQTEPQPISPQESADWFNAGNDLYGRVYGSKDRLLKQKVMSMAPEVFRWMLIEGYGKVLSRPGLALSRRELCIIAQLTMENREKQLHSHLRGALNVGVPKSLVIEVVEDLGQAAGIGYRTATKLLAKLEA